MNGMYYDANGNRISEYEYNMSRNANLLIVAKKIMSPRQKKRFLRRVEK